VKPIIMAGKKGGVLYLLVHVEIYILISLILPAFL
jgi:hypothetical protein